MKNEIDPWSDDYENEIKKQKSKFGCLWGIALLLPIVIVILMLVDSYGNNHQSVSWSHIPAMAQSVDGHPNEMKIILNVDSTSFSDYGKLSTDYKIKFTRIIHENYSQAKISLP
jgi:hypothetical protein